MRYAFQNAKKHWQRRGQDDRTATLIAVVAVVVVAVCIVATIAIGISWIVNPVGPKGNNIRPIGIAFVIIGVLLFMLMTFGGRVEELTPKAWAVILTCGLGAFLLGFITPWLIMAGLITVMAGIVVWDMRR